MTLKITVTKIVEENEVSELSGSITELGPDAAQITWENSLSLVDEYREYLRGDVEKEEFLSEVKGHFAEYGADLVNDETTENELFALLIQEIAAAYREIEDFDDEELMEALVNGDTTGRLYRSDEGYIFSLGL